MISQKKKNFEIYCSHLTGQRYCSYLLFTVLFNVTVHDYCWSQYKKLYCNTIYLLHYYIAIQFSSFLPLQYTLVYCNTISFIALQVTIQSFLQYNIAFQPAIQFCIATHLDYYCNTIQATQAFFSTIQFCVLQYNASTTSPSHVTIQCLSCNTISLQFFQPSLLQYNCKACNTIFFFLHNTTDYAANICFIIIFFSSYFHWRDKNLYTFFLSPIHPINL